MLRSAEVLTPEQELDLGTFRRTFAIRAHDAVTTTLAPLLVQSVAEVAPGVTLRFLGESAQDGTDLRRGVIDLEIGSAVPSLPDIDHQVAREEELVGIARSGHPILEDHVDLGRWAAAPHVVVSRKGRLRDRIDDQLDAVGVSRRVVASVASTGAAVEVVRTTGALLIVPASVAARVGSDVATFTPPVELSPVNVVLAWHRQFSADRGHQWLRTLARELLSQPIPLHLGAATRHGRPARGLVVDDGDARRALEAEIHLSSARP